VIPPFGTAAPKQPVKGRLAPALPAPVAAKKTRPAKEKEDHSPPGLKLLSRLGKGGKAGEKKRQKL
jgi:hypothetical protein